MSEPQGLEDREHEALVTTPLSGGRSLSQAFPSPPLSPRARRAGPPHSRFLAMLIEHRLCTPATLGSGVQRRTRQAEGSDRMDTTHIPRTSGRAAGYKE